MYGQNNDTDLVVKYYDESFGIGSDIEMAWYLDKVRQFGGPVLDLACGTGRLALEVANLGVDIVGIDQSEGMLDRFNLKLELQEENIKKLVRFEKQPMSAFRLDQQFKTIICCDAFFHNLTVEEEIACLHAVREHLAPEGRFVFNVPNPTCAFIDHAEKSNGTLFSQRGTFDLHDGNTLIVEHAQAGDRQQQTITTTNRVSLHDASDRLIKQGESQWKSRYLYKYEAIHLLYRCGFEVESLVGNYKNEPVGKAGQFIFQVKHHKG